MNKSIYEYIVENLDDRRRLPKDFTLQKYKRKANEYLEDGAVDGVLYLYRKFKPGKRFPKFLRELILETDEEHCLATCNELDFYFSYSDAGDGIKVIEYFDKIVKLVVEMQKEVSKEMIMELAIMLLIQGRNVETVKVGLAIVATVDIDSFPELRKVVYTLGLSDEFTLFVDNLIDDSQYAKEIRFDMAQRLHGWGRVFVIERLEPDEDDIRLRKWLLDVGSKNDIDYSLNALGLAIKLDITALLQLDTLTEEDFMGIRNIMVGLLDEDKVYGISKIKNKERLCTLYMSKLEEKYNDKMTYYEVPIRMAKYYTEHYQKDKKESDEALNLMIYLRRLFTSENVRNLLETTLKREDENVDDVKIAMDIIEYYEMDEYYDLVFEKFKKDPITYFKAFSFLVIRPQNHENLEKCVLKALTKNKYTFTPTTKLGITDNEVIALIYILETIADLPCCFMEILKLSFKCDMVYPRNRAIDVLYSWRDYTKLDVLSFPEHVFDVVKELLKREVVESNKIGIINIIETEQEKKNRRETIKREGLKVVPNIYLDNYYKFIKDRDAFRRLKRAEIISLKKEETNVDTYIAKIKDIDENKEYDTKLICNKNGDIVDVSCNCKCTHECNHEYALLKHIKDNKLM